LENGTHVLTSVQLGPYVTAERTLALSALPGLTPEMLCLADRGFLSFALWRAACATGAALVWCAPATVTHTLPVTRRPLPHVAAIPPSGRAAAAPGAERPSSPRYARRASAPVAAASYRAARSAG
jgi:hypothetical protein